jgi:hypothetical protein
MAINITGGAQARAGLGLDLTGGGNTTPATPAFWTFVIFGLLLLALLAIAHSLR